MEEYKCPICYQLFKCKNNLIKHQEKKNKCNIITPFKCEKCCKYFKQNRSLLTHMNKCDFKNNKISIITEDNHNYTAIRSIIISKDTDDVKLLLLKKYNTVMSDDELKIMLKSSMLLDGKVSLFYSMLNSDSYLNINSNTIKNNTIKNNTVENSNNNVTNNIQINNFGNEKIDYLDKDYFKDLIMNQHIEKGYVQLIKDIYLNKEHPENKTVKVENINNKYALVFNNDKWDTILKSDLKEMIHKKNYTVLKMHYDKLKKSMSAPKREETYSFLARDETDDPHMMYVIDKIILLFYNDTDNDISNDADEEINNKKTKNI